MTTYNYEQMCDYLFKWHAPNFNFELGGEELLDLGLDRGFIKVASPEGTHPRDAVYYVNEEY